MTTQILNDFHGDGVFRDQQGTMWVRQSEMIAGMTRAWDEGWADRHGLPENRVLLTRDGRARNPYRAAKGEQK